MKKVIFAPDSFKGTLSAQKACDIWQAAAKRVIPETHCISLPLSDGGEGLVETVSSCLGGEKVIVPVNDPLGRRIRAEYLLLPDGRAVIEMAAASGLTLLSADERNPTLTSSSGTGELICHAIDSGVSQIILGLGGSATNDGGVGAAKAIGLKLEKPDGIYTGLDASEFRERIKNVNFITACDVTNPLCGPLGASAVYGPQKGATDEQVRMLDDELLLLAEIFTKDSGKDCANVPGCGAAGGFILPFLSYGDVVMCSGIDTVLDILGFDKLLEEAILVLTGEGRTDTQSAMGKVVAGVARRSRGMGIPVIVLSGSLAPGCDALYDLGVTAMFSTCTEPTGLDEALKNSQKNLEQASENLFRMLKEFIM